MSATVTPVTRTLAAVLRRQIDDAGHGLQLLVGKVTAIPDANHVTVEIEGLTRTIPRLAIYTPTVGKPVYVLAAATFAVAVGDVGGVTGGGGAQGPPGPAGTPGEVWFTGSGAPSGATGIVGDWYLNSANGDYYEKTGTSAWTLRGNLKGPKGDTGAQGPAGTPGTGGAVLLAHAEQNGSVSVTATSPASANVVVTAPALTFDGVTKIRIAACAGYLRLPTSGGNTTELYLFDGATNLARLTHVEGTAGMYVAVGEIVRYYTPSAGSHTFSVRAICNGGTGAVIGGGGGTGGADIPTFLRIETAS